MPGATMTREIVRAVDARRLAIVLIAIAGVLLAIDIPELRYPHVLSHNALLGVPNLLAGLSLAAASLLALVLSDEVPGRRSRDPRWLALAVVLGLLALHRLAAADQRALQRLDADTALALVEGPAAVLALALLALALVAPLERRGVLVAGALVEVAVHGLLVVTRMDVAGEASSVMLVGAALLLFAQLRVLQRRPGWTPSGEGLDPLRLTALAASDADVRRAALLMAALIAGLGLLGAAVNPGGLSLDFLDMNEEQTLPAFASGALLLAAGLLALLLARLDRESGFPPAWWTALGACFAFLAVDEVLALHEALQDATGVKGQVFLLPLVAVAGAAWLAAVRRLADLPTARSLLVGGAAAWLVSQLVDLTQRGPERDHPTVVPEEVLEMTGSALFVLATLVVAQRCLRQARQTAPVAAEPARR
jgi:hypothetical protein